MFGKHKLMRDGAKAEALVLDKKVWGTMESSGTPTACTYELRVRFEDGSTVEISRRAMSQKTAWVDLGDSVPVRYDPADRSKIEIDSPALEELQEGNARALKERLLAAGEARFAKSAPQTPNAPAAAPPASSPAGGRLPTLEEIKAAGRTPGGAGALRSEISSSDAAQHSTDEPSR